jgi:hypothetical protein
MPKLHFTLQWLWGVKNELTNGNHTKATQLFLDIWFHWTGYAAYWDTSDFAEDVRNHYLERYQSHVNTLLEKIEMCTEWGQILNLLTRETAEWIARTEEVTDEWLLDRLDKPIHEFPVLADIERFIYLCTQSEFLDAPQETIWNFTRQMIHLISNESTDDDPLDPLEFLRIFLHDDSRWTQLVLPYWGDWDAEKPTLRPTSARLRAYRRRVPHPFLPEYREDADDGDEVDGEGADDGDEVDDEGADDVSREDPAHAITGPVWWQGHWWEPDENWDASNYEHPERHIAEHVGAEMETIKRELNTTLTDILETNDQGNRNGRKVYEAFLKCITSIWQESVRDLPLHMSMIVDDILNSEDEILTNGQWMMVIDDAWNSWHACKIYFTGIVLPDDIANKITISHGDVAWLPTDHFPDHNRLNPADLKRCVITYNGREVSRRWPKAIDHLFRKNKRAFMEAWVRALRDKLPKDQEHTVFFTAKIKKTDVMSYVEDVNWTPEELKNLRTADPTRRFFVLPRECLRESTTTGPLPIDLADFCESFGFPYKDEERSEEQIEEGLTFERACQLFTIRYTVAFFNCVYAYRKHKLDWDRPELRLIQVSMAGKQDKDNQAQELISDAIKARLGITEEDNGRGERVVKILASSFANPYLVRL